MMYRAPHEKKKYRRIAYIKEAYLSNPYIWTAISALVATSFWLKQEQDIL
jgi:hypothetical protein